MAQRPCPECGTLLPEGSKAKTCGTSRCRKRRQRRLAKARTPSERNAQSQALALIARDADEMLRVAREVMQAELTPIVREQIGDDVLKAIAALGKLTPVLVQSLGHDLTSEDSNVRTRAQGIVAKYTLGQADSSTGQPAIQVNLGNIPDPRSPQRASVPGTLEPGEVVDVERICERCDESKPVGDFDGEATRCRACQADIKAAMEARLSG